MEKQLPKKTMYVDRLGSLLRVMVFHVIAMRGRQGHSFVVTLLLNKSAAFYVIVYLSDNNY
jgi:hypothetical protein